MSLPEAPVQAAVRTTLTRMRRPRGIGVQSVPVLEPGSFAAFSRGRRWLDELLNRNVTSIKEIAHRERCSARKVNIILSLAFLARDLVKNWNGGSAPMRHRYCAAVRPTPSWSEQFQRLGIPQPRPD
jgi:hypothetical protein